MASKPTPPSGVAVGFPLLGIDFGEKRTGIAIAQRLDQQASPNSTSSSEPFINPLETINTSSRDELLRLLVIIILEWKPSAIIIGRPANHPDGRVRRLSKMVDKLARQIHGRTRLPVISFDETLTSDEATRLLTYDRNKEARDRSKRETKNDRTDAVAAVIILKDYLNQHGY